MSRRLATFCLVSTLSLPGTISAQETSTPATSTTTATEGEANTEAKTDATPATPSEAAVSAQVPARAPRENLRQDPQGVRGISPFWEEVQKGDAAFSARDLVAAQTFYKAAIFKSPRDPQGHLRMAELSLDQGKLDEAETFAAAALRFSGEDLRAKTKASFLMSEIRERQRALEEAIVNWRAYKSMSAQLPAPDKIAVKGPQAARIYPVTADARIAAIETVKKLDADYEAVRKRLQKDLVEANQAAAGK